MSKIKEASLEALVFAAEFIKHGAQDQRIDLLDASGRVPELCALPHHETEHEVAIMQSVLREKRSRLAMIGDLGPDAPTQDISVAALYAEIDKHNAADEEFGRHVKALSVMQAHRDARIKDVERLTLELQQANADLAAHNARFFDHAQVAPPKPDPNAIVETQKALAAAEKHNERCRQGREKKKLDAELLSLEAQLTAKEKELGQIESEKMALMNLDALVPGLRVTETEVLLNEKPLSEASLEQQMEVGLAVYEAQHKEEPVPEGT